MHSGTIIKDFPILIKIIIIKEEQTLIYWEKKQYSFDHQP